jgi:hypothetical protein
VIVERLGAEHTIGGFMSKARVVVLEGTWWSNHEVPLVLPYFNALSISHREIDLSHRTIRSAEDIAYYVSKISKNSKAMLYFACHGEEMQLKPSGENSKISQQELIEALTNAKEGAISFVHFGCCEMVEPRSRRASFEKIMEVTGAKWVSGYTEEVDWLTSTLLDLALVKEVFVPYYVASDGRAASLKRKAKNFVSAYEQLARALGFSALSKVTGGTKLFPNRLHTQ